MYSGITSGRVLDGELLYTKILEVNLFAFAYRLFHTDFSPINVVHIHTYIHTYITNDNRNKRIYTETQNFKKRFSHNVIMYMYTYKLWSNMPCCGKPLINWLIKIT